MTLKTDGFLKSEFEICPLLLKHVFLPFFQISLYTKKLMKIKRCTKKRIFSAIESIVVVTKRSFGFVTLHFQETTTEYFQCFLKNLFEKVENSAISPSLYLIRFSKTNLKNKGV